MKIKEVIVVEGIHDSQNLKKHFDCDTIETGGLAIDEKCFRRIEEAQKKRGVIIFTDPDFPGTKIRNLINQRIPGCKNAFIDKKVSRTTKKVGIEHAGYDDLYESLTSLFTYQEQCEQVVCVDDLVSLGLSGQSDSSNKRNRIGNKYHIGECNSKTFCKRWNMLGYSLAQLEKEAHNE